MISTIGNIMRQRSQYNRTVRELGRLTDRELSDLGIGRSEIRAVARANVSGK
jgi:uncharacterized protein YjiS (DUF1127 family)